MLRLTKLTDYAIVVLAEMAANPAARLSSSQLAAVTRISEPTVAKILKQLACAGLIASYRGAQGGYCLPLEPNEVTMRHIIEAIDGPISLHLGEKERARMDDRMASRRLSALADDDRAEMGARALPADRLSGRLLLFGAEEHAGAGLARSGRSRTAETYEKLGIPLREQEIAGRPRRRRRRRVRFRLGRDDLQGKLAEAGVIFCPISEAVREHPELVRKYLGTVVPATDNYFATLNSAVFTDGSFVYVPPGVRCPMELSTYFRINEQNTGQFERTLIIADKGSYVSYLEGCTAPKRDENQLHAAVVELVAMEDAEIKYSTVQNWYPGDEEGKGGIYNFVTKRGDLPRRALEDFVDAGRDRFGHHLEVPELHPAGR
jgi:Rrf2 family protein